MLLMNCYIRNKFSYIRNKFSYIRNKFCLNQTIVEPAEEMVVNVLSRYRTIIRGKENTDAFVDLGEVMYSSTEEIGK